MKKEIKKLMDRPDVQFVGEGKKIINGIQTDEDAIMIGVEKKLPSACLSKEEMIPKKIKVGLFKKKKTDVVEAEKLRALSENYDLGSISPDERVKKWDTFRPGISVANFRTTAGTAGAIVYTYDVESNDPIPGENNPVPEPDIPVDPDPIPDPTPNPTDNWGILKSIFLFILKILEILFSEEGAYTNKYKKQTMVRTKTILRKPFGLTNYHVAVCDDTGQIGDEIWQPGPHDTTGSKNVIGHLTGYAPIDPNTSNTVDAALFSLKPDLKYDDSILDIGKLSPPFIYRDIKVGDMVWKSGRTTGLTKARIVALNAATKIYYEFNGREVQVLFEKQIITEYMCEGGDSGSLVVININGKWYAIGLLFAGSCSTTVINYIDEVIKKLPIPVTFG